MTQPASTAVERLLGGKPTYCRKFLHAGVMVEELILCDVEVRCPACSERLLFLGSCDCCNGAGFVRRWRIYWAREPWSKKEHPEGVANPLIKCDCDGEAGVDDAREKVKVQFDKFYGIVQKGDPIL